jgi:tRNA-Thr(GGU) m(6)t(6)A37 methyltransferase TsaA
MYIDSQSMTGADVRFIGSVEQVDGDYSTILIFPEFLDGLDGIQSKNKLYILYWLHQRDSPEHRSILKVVPRRHGATRSTGVFNTRSPSRPNPIGLTIVDLVKVKSNKLIVKGLDAFKGSPILDIKPANHE